MIATGLSAFNPEAAAIQAGRTDVSLGNTKGQAVLVWITRLAPDGQVRIAELGVTG